MQKILLTLVALALPLPAIAQDAAKAAPAKNVVNVNTLEPKPGEASLLEAALSAHAKKYHHGDFAWHISRFLSGPNEGNYLIVEGGSSWTAIDGRGDLGAEHMKDYNATVQPHVAKATHACFYRKLDELSVKSGETSNKSLVYHLAVKPGRGGELFDSLKQWREIFAKLGMTVDVWERQFSGSSEYVLVIGLKDGLKTFDQPTPAFRNAATELYGPRALDRLEQVKADTCTQTWSELTEYLPDLGSK